MHFFTYHALGSGSSSTNPTPPPPQLPPVAPLRKQSNLLLTIPRPCLARRPTPGLVPPTISCSKTQKTDRITSALSAPVLHKPHEWFSGFEPPNTCTVRSEIHQFGMGKKVPMGNATPRRRGYYHRPLVTRLETIKRQLRETERDREHARDCNAAKQCRFAQELQTLNFSPKP